MPTTGNTCRMEEGEEKSLVTRPVVVVNLQQMMNEVEATMNPSRLTDTPVSDPKIGILQQTTPAYTANPPDDQNKCMDSGEEANSPEEGIYDVLHHDNINRNTTMIANNKPTSGTNTNVIRHPQRKAAQRQTLILGIEDQGDPKERISTTHLW